MLLYDILTAYRSCDTILALNETALQGSFLIFMDRKNLSISFTFPYPKFIQRILGFSFAEVGKNFLYRMQTFNWGVQQRVSRFSRFGSFFSQFLRFPRFNNFNKKNIFRILFPVIVILIGAYAIYSVTSSSRTEKTVLSNNTVISLGEPIGRAKIDREFSFPIKDAKGKKIDSFSYVLQDAELRDEIIVKGKRATAVEGRMFLIINLKITNGTQNGLQINTRDYVRLSVNNDTSEWLAAEIHNDPVEVQAISTKYTRIGFPIDKGDINYTIQVGEINGVKEQIKLDFK